MSPLLGLQKKTKLPEKSLVVHLCVGEGSYPAEMVAHPLAELVGVAILSGDHSSIPAPAPCPSPEELTQLHLWTIVLFPLDLAAL